MLSRRMNSSRMHILKFNKKIYLSVVYITRQLSLNGGILKYCLLLINTDYSKTSLYLIVGLEGKIT